MKASYMLQAKVGSGDIDTDLIERSQQLIDTFQELDDFTDTALEHLSRYKKAIEDAKQHVVKGGGDEKRLLAALTEPVMQIKANAAIYNYGLVGNLANIMMNFLEAVDGLDQNVIEISEALNKTLSLLLGNKMAGDGGQYGAELETELKDACRRYFARQEIALREDTDAFFVDG